MSQAEELLDSLVEAYADEHDNNSDQHIVIGTDRVIVVPEELKRIAVQYDHNMRTVTFDCPRYYDGRDMSKMRVYITIEGPLGARSRYIADNVRVDNKNPNVMHFDWTIKRTITSVDGPITFLVCIRNADDEGNDENHWNSELNSEMYISKGMEYDSEMLEAEYPDVVTQLLDRMDTVEVNASAQAMQGYANNWLNDNVDTVLNDIRIKGAETLESIPEDYTATFDYAIEGALTKADAIIRTVEGDNITVADSSDDYIRSLRVFGKTRQFTTTGKNLLKPITKTHTPGNVEIGINADGSIRVAGIYEISSTVTKFAMRTDWPIDLSANVTYTLSGTSNNITLMLSSSSSYTLAVDDGNGVSYTPSEDMKVYLGIEFKTNTTINATVYPMVRLASIEDPTWEPYTGGIPSPNPDYPQDLVSIENPTVNIYGKNLIPPRDSASTYAGITYVTNADGSVSISGTTTSDGDSTYYIVTKEAPLTLPKGAYTFSGCNGGSEKSYRMLMYTVDWKLVTKCLDGPVTFTLDKTTDVFMYIWVYRGTTVNETLHPMLCRESFGDSTYESHIKPQTLNLNRTIPGIPVTSGGNYTDSDGQQWVCDEVDFERGVYVQRIGTAMLANSYTEYSVLSATGRGQLIIAPTPAKNQYLYGTICSMAIRNSDALSAVHGEYYENPANIVLVGNVGDTEVAMREKFADVKYLYALATPIEIPLTAEELSTFTALRTNYHNTTVLNDSGVKMELKYNADTEMYITNAIRDAEFVVNINGFGASDTFTSDKTSSTIYNAYTRGKIIRCKVHIDNLEGVHGLAFEGQLVTSIEDVSVFMVPIFVGDIARVVFATIVGSTVTVHDFTNNT